MRLRKRFAIAWKNGRQIRWVEYNPSFSLVDDFTPHCIMDESQANAFLKIPAVDKRYCKVTIRMEAKF